MERVWKMFFVLVVILAFSVPAFGEGAFVIGVAPHTSARIILEMYQPLRLFLEKDLGKPVEVVTAPDFDTFARRAIAGEYDLAITTGQQARLLQLDAGYLPLLTYQADFKAVVLVAAKGPVRAAKDLKKGGTVLGLSPTSQVTLWGQHWLMDNGLAKVPVKYVSASDSVAQLVIAGEAVAGFTSLANYQKLSPETQSGLKILTESKPMLGRVYLLNGHHKADLKRIDKAIWAFAATPEAQQYFVANKLNGYRKIKPAELKAMNHFANEVRNSLKAKGP